MAWTQFQSYLYRSLPKESARTKFVANFGTDPSPERVVEHESWVFWNYPSGGYPYAFDVSPTNGRWLYVGFDDCILISQDGGFTWDNVISDEGAYDVCVHPLIPSIITYWNTTGELKQAISGSVQAALLTETARRQHGRIAYDPRAAYLYVMAFNGSSYTLKRKFPAQAWESLLTGVSEPRHLQAFMGGTAQANRVAFVNATDIWYSLDGGSTFAAKKGDWSGYSSGVTIHFEPEAE